MKDDKTNRGQEKVHEAVNPTTGEKRTFTQREWRERDKSEGWERPDADVQDEPEGDDADVPEQTPQQ